VISFSADVSQNPFLLPVIKESLLIHWGNTLNLGELQSQAFGQQFAKSQLWYHFPKCFPDASVEWHHRFSIGSAKQRNCRFMSHTELDILPTSAHFLESS